MLGLLVGAYEIGYHRKHAQPSASAPAPSPPAKTTTTPAKTTTTPASGTAAVRGKQLFTADGCGSCHSLDGSQSVGPTLQSLAGSRVQLADGRTLTADDAYLAKAITDPDADIVKGYQKGLMTGAVASFGLDAKPSEVAALVAFIKAQG